MRPLRHSGDDAEASPRITRMSTDEGTPLRKPSVPSMKSVVHLFLIRAIPVFAPVEGCGFHVARRSARNVRINLMKPLRRAFIRAGRICVAASIQSLAFAIAPHVKRSSSRIRQCHGRMLTVAAIRPRRRTCYRLHFCYRNILDASLSQATNALLTMSQSTPTLAQLQRGLQLSEQIAALEAELAALFSGSPAPKAVAAAAIAAAPVAKAPAAGKKGGMSAAGRARIVAAQKARWAKIRAGKAPAPKAPAAKAPAAPAAKAAKVTGKKKRVVSPEVKAKLAAAMKARWAAAKAGKGPSPTSKKK